MLETQHKSQNPKRRAPRNDKASLNEISKIMDASPVYFKKHEMGIRWISEAQKP